MRAESGKMCIRDSNNIPLLVFPADTFASRQPDPVLQQLEVSGSLAVSTNDAFKPVCKYWDRITRPEQVMTALISAMTVSYTHLNIDFVEDRESKKSALQTIMLHNTGKSNWEFSEDMLDAVLIFQMEVTQISCTEHL